jgi:hypothetical protein
MTDENTILMVWNRAVLSTPAPFKRGEHALTILLRFHGRVMNGGVFDAIESTTSGELEDALDAYTYFGYEPIKSLCERARAILIEQPQRAEQEEQVFDVEYGGLVSDEQLYDSVRARIFEQPQDFQLN